MKIKWLGHACFLITSSKGRKIITDPYTVNENVKYTQVNEAADIVSVSHDHHDHNAVTSVQGNPVIVKGNGVWKMKEIEFRGVPTYHDDCDGSKRGNNTVFRFVVDGFRLCHLGDLGHMLNQSQMAGIGQVDILFIPVGGYYTIDAQVATTIVDMIRPGITIPMHYKTARLDFPIVGVDDFLKGKQNVRMLDTSEIEYTPETLPIRPGIVVFQPVK